MKKKNYILLFKKYWEWGDQDWKKEKWEVFKKKQNNCFDEFLPKFYFCIFANLIFGQFSLTIEWFVSKLYFSSILVLEHERGDRGSLKNSDGKRKLVNDHFS